MRIFLISMLFLFSVQSLGFSFGFDKSGGLRDPFMIPLKDVSELEQEDFFKTLPFEVEIKGVIMNDKKKYVVINDDIVQERENWRGLTIEEISKDFLIVNYNQKKVKVFFKNK